jgi:protein SDA1
LKILQFICFTTTLRFQVAQCYPKETKDFPSHLSTLLLDNYGTLMPDTRKTLVQNLVMLRNKDVITSIE